MRRLRAAGVIVAGWTVFGVLLAQQVYVLQRGQGPAGPWTHAMALQLDFCWLWALVTPLVLWLGRTFPLLAPAGRRGARFWARAAVHLPASVLVGVTVQAVHAVLLSRLFPAWFPRPSLSDVGRSMMYTVDYGAMLYGLVLLIGQSITYVTTLHQAQLRQAELQEQLAGAQLQALQMQMHPHFLFNALNSIAELIHEDPAIAEQMVTRLGELLRIYLRSSETQEISLTQEVDFLRRYLDIQKVRFEERLSVRIDLGAETQSAVVPSLILQPLVENAILHGIAERETEGFIGIDVTVGDGALTLRVTDNGDGLPRVPPARRVEGRGLSNTRRRLERLYGPEHDFSVDALEGGGTCARIRIPLKRVAHEVSA